MANGATDNKSGGQQKKPSGPKFRVQLMMRPLPNGQAEFQAILIGPPHLVSDKRITFEVNDKIQPDTDSAITDADGVATYIYQLPTGTDIKDLKVKATAAVEGQPSATNVVDIAAIPRPSIPTIYAEHVEVGAGVNRYYLALIDQNTKWNLTGIIDGMVKHQMWMKMLRPVHTDYEPIEDAFGIDLSHGFAMVEIKTDMPGRQEIDMFPRGFATNHKQLDIYGPYSIPIQARRDSPALVRAFDGCE